MKGNRREWRERQEEREMRGGRDEGEKDRVEGRYERREKGEEGDKRGWQYVMQGEGE